VPRNGLLHRHPATGDGIEDTQDLRDRTVTDPWPGGFRPDFDAAPPLPRARVSAWATLSLALGLVAVCTTLTGLLVPEGIALGALAVLASVAGLVGASRPGVTGPGLALLGLLAGLAAAGLGAAAITGHLSWLDGHADAVPRWHAWLVAHWAWLRRW
jgi:hypothetical protein